MNLAPLGIITCPIDDCMWVTINEAPEIDPGALAGVFGLGVMSSIALDQHHRNLEELIDKHLKSHTVLEWVKTVSRLRSQLATANAQIEGVRG